MSKDTNTIEALAKDLGITNPYAMPRITKVVVNAGVGKQRDSKQYVEAVQRDLAVITGQKPNERRARKAISGFNVRQGNLVGYAVTLRGKRMEDFMQRFIHITLPRVRDFRGLATSSLDGQGNLSVGLREQLAFPEIHADKTDVIFGVEVTFVTSTQDNELAKKMFATLGFPLRSAEDDEA
jgi:large subunit ribosomal protein L5